MDYSFVLCTSPLWPIKSSLTHLMPSRVKGPLLPELPPTIPAQIPLDLIPTRGNDSSEENLASSASKSSSSILKAFLWPSFGLDSLEGALGDLCFSLFGVEGTMGGAA